MYRETIDNYFAGIEAQLVDTIAGLVAIRSVRGEAGDAMPYGPGPAEALALGLKLAEEMGLITRNLDNQVGIVDLNDKESRLGILCHLDVVDGGEGWNTPPFSVAIKDGLLYGRGVSDNKGPTAAALYAVKAVRDLNIPLRYNVRLILGTAEETGITDIEYYLAHEVPPPHVFAPDGTFPVENTEKGSLRGICSKTWDESDKLPRIKSIKGGQVVSIVPARAEAIVEGLSPEEIVSICDRVGKATGASFSVTGHDGAVQIVDQGKSAHAATPETGCNAITALLTALAELPIAPSECFSTVKALNQVFPHGDYLGEAIGIAQADELSGPLTLSLDIFDLSPTGFRGHFDSRMPLCATKENSLDVVEQRLAALGIRAESRMQPPHHTPCDSHFVQTLLRAYERYSGNEGYCVAIGGWSYVHHIEGGVCFGACMPGFEPNWHGANECMSIKDLITASKIYAQAIIDLCS